MKKLHFVFFLILFYTTGCSIKSDSTLIVQQIKCNGAENPAGTPRIPDFSWILSSGIRGAEQTAYQLIVSSDQKSSEKSKGIVWNSGKIVSAENAWIKY